MYSGFTFHAAPASPLDRLLRGVHWCTADTVRGWLANELTDESLRASAEPSPGEPGPLAIKVCQSICFPHLLTAVHLLADAGFAIPWPTVVARSARKRAFYRQVLLPSAPARELVAAWDADPERLAASGFRWPTCAILLLRVALVACDLHLTHLLIERGVPGAQEEAVVMLSVAHSGGLLRDHSPPAFVASVQQLAELGVLGLVPPDSAAFAWRAAQPNPTRAAIIRGTKRARSNLAKALPTLPPDLCGIVGTYAGYSDLRKLRRPPSRCPWCIKALVAVFPADADDPPPPSGCTCRV